MLFSGRFRGFGFNPDEIKMNVVENSSNSNGNNNGNGNGNNYANDKGKGIDNNHSSNKRKFYENNDVNNNKDSGNSNVKRARLDGVVSEQLTSNGVRDQLLSNVGNTYH